MEDIIKTGSLVDISKEDSDYPGFAKFTICVEGEVDKDGDVFAPMSVDMMREKGTLVSFQHNNTPAGTWELSREGNKVYANVKFLDTEAGQNTRKYLRDMGTSAQFSFRARVEEYEERSGITGLVYNKVKAYEASPVFVGAGNTQLSTIKSATENTMSDFNVEDIAKALDSVLDKRDADKASADEVTKVNERIAELEKSLEQSKVDVEKQIRELSMPDASAEVEKAWARPKKFAYNNAVVELSKSMFESQDSMDLFKDIGSKSGKVEIKKDVGMEVIKDSLSSAGTIAYDAVRAEVVTPVKMLDLCYFQAWNSEVYRRRVQGPANPLPVEASTTIGESDATIEPEDFTIRTIATLQPVSLRASTADPSILASTSDILMRDLRRILQAQVVAGAGTGEALRGIGLQVNTASTSFSSAVPTGNNAANEVLTDLVYPRVLEVRGRGGEPNYVLGDANFTGHIYTTLTNQRSPFLGTQMLPYGAPMGVGAVLTPQMPANTALIASLGDPMFHVIPMMSSFVVELDYSAGFTTDEVVLRAKVYCQSVVVNPKGFHRFTTTENTRDG